jgi:hypothetical protein
MFGGDPDSRICKFDLDKKQMISINLPILTHMKWLVVDDNETLVISTIGFDNQRLCKRFPMR